jgi:hypothetical protein
MHRFFANRARREHEAFNKLLEIAPKFRSRVEKEGCSLDDIDYVAFEVIFSSSLMAGGLAYPKEDAKRGTKRTIG